MLEQLHDYGVVQLTLPMVLGNEEFMDRDIPLDLSSTILRHRSQ